ncbi:MAG: hypothetical protein IIA67_10270 [Planctomycetes bacterium]|nr:hypothetical protein [Planctomycetota bacterium]
MNRSWGSRGFAVLLLASVLLAGCSGGEKDDDVLADNKEDVAALRNLGAKFEVNNSGHIRRVEFPRSTAEGADPLSPNGPTSQGGVSNDDLKHLEGLPGLSVLVLYGTRIGDEGMVHLAKLKNLESLVLMQTSRVTDKGLDHLGDLKRLEKLDLFGTQVSDAGIEKLARLSQLKSLNVSQTQVTKQGYEKLKREMPNTKIAEYRK